MLTIAAQDGVAVRVASCVNDRDEAVVTARWLAAMHANGTRWSDLLVVAPGKRKWRDRLEVALAAAGVPHQLLLGTPGARPDAGVDTVPVTSLYGAETLSLSGVAVVGLGDLPWKRQALDEALRIVAATVRVATRDLHVTRSRTSPLTERLFVDAG